MINYQAIIKYVNTPVCTLSWQLDKDISAIHLASRGTLKVEKMDDEKLFAMLAFASAEIKCNNGRFLGTVCSLQEFLTAFRGLSSSWSVDYSSDEKIKFKPPEKVFLGTAHG